MGVVGAAACWMSSRQMPASVRGAGTGGEEDGFGVAGEGLFGGGELVVADDVAFGAEVAEEVDQVEGEAVVVVDEEDHG